MGKVFTIQLVYLGRVTAEERLHNFQRNDLKIILELEPLLLKRAHLFLQIKTLYADVGYKMVTKFKYNTASLESFLKQKHVYFLNCYSILLRK